MMSGEAARIGVSLTLLAAVNAACGGWEGREPVERVLLVTIDTLRWDRLGYMGYPVATPNLDRLAASGVAFHQAVSPAPITLPAHASIMTGLYPPGHRTRNNGSFRLPDELSTLSESFREAGFATGAFIGAFVLDRRFGLEQGFDVYDDELPEENPLHSVYFAERRAEVVVERALAWIEERGDEPFFLWVHLYDPHAPHDPPSPFAEMYADPYDAEIAYTDDALGPLLDAVGDESKPTAVVVVADHGESLGEHGESSHTLFVYDATMRVPLLIRAPGLPAGRVVKEQVRSVDIYPTLLELAGLPLPAAEEVDGVSLLAHLESESASEPFPSRPAYGETFATRFDFNWSELRFLRDEGFKFIDAPRPELYDLRSDPDELTNLWSEDPPDVGRRLARALARLESEEDSGALVPTAEIDEETSRRLESLGYLSASPSSGVEERERPDPKDRVEVFQKLQELLGTEATDEESIAAYEEILRLEPGNAMARSRLANKFSETGRFEEAVEQYQALMRETEIGSKGLENLAVALLLLKRTDEALAITERAVAEAPWYLELQVLRGEALEQAGRLPEAMEAYEKAIALRPESPENYWRHGVVALRDGDRERAERDFRDALERDPSHEQALASLSRLLTQSGRAEEALELVGGASATPDVLAARAEAHLAEGRIEDARELLERARFEDPDNVRALMLLGSIHGRAGELAEAAAAFERARALGETDPELRRNLGLVYLRQGRGAAAVAELRLAAADAREDASVWFTLGNAYLQTRESALAAAAFETALEHRPDWPEAVFNLALAYEESGEMMEAAASYRRFLAGPGAQDVARREAAERRLAALPQD